MSLIEERSYFKPFSYPWAFDYYLKQQQMHWLPTEVAMADDIADWERKLTGSEKNLITQILRFFTQGDIGVAKGYVERYLQYFKPPELQMMLLSFASMECAHIHAYSHLLDTLGLPETEYKAFQEYQEMVDKHEYLFTSRFDNINTHDPFDENEQVRWLALELAKFSAFAEGLQLFSSFLILMNFQRFGKLKGLGQIVAWSVRDESLHVEAMIKVFNTFIDENPKIWNDEFKREIYQACRDMVDLEDKFIDLAFGQSEIQGLTKEEVKEYIRYIADRRLLQLKLKPNYGVKENPVPWFEEILNGVEHASFFETRVTEYSKGIERGNWAEAF